MVVTVMQRVNRKQRGSETAMMTVFSAQGTAAAPRVDGHLLLHSRNAGRVDLHRCGVDQLPGLCQQAHPGKVVPEK